MRSTSVRYQYVFRNFQEISIAFYSSTIKHGRRFVLYFLAQSVRKYWCGMQTKRMWNNIFFDLFRSLEVLSNADAANNYRNHIKNSKRTCNFQDFELLHLFFLCFPIYFMQIDLCFIIRTLNVFWFLFQELFSLCLWASISYAQFNEIPTFLYLLCLILFARSFRYLAYFLIHHS